MIADRYRLERKVGGGRVSAVWRVRDEISSRPCAIKFLHRSMHKHPEALTRFSLEDRLARELTGPHFPERVGSGVWDGMRYIAWRWHEGESLRALFERNPKQDAPSVHSIVQETCQALSLVHAAGYSHGDLKPENILFADRGEGERSSRQIKLLGFGVASRLARPSAAGFGVSRRRAGELVGTPLYSSPDLILGRVPNGGQADLWALAVIVYEALTGRPPFLGHDIGAVLQAILEKRAPRPSSVADNLPGSFDTWWAQALAQEFDTPSEFAGALARALAPALRTSHTQRSASLPERAPAALETLMPVPASPPGDASTTASGIGPTDVGLARPPTAPKPSGKPASLAPAAAPSLVAPRARAAAATALPAAAAQSPGASLAPSASLAATTPGLAAASAPAAAARPTHAAPQAVARAGASAPAAAPSAAAPSVLSTHAGLGAGASAASPPLTAGVPPLHDDAGRPEPAMSDTFAPFPSPLRDLGAEGARKTLVGITPPTLLQSIASAVAAKPGARPPAAPAPAVHAAPNPTPGEKIIEGAPCKPIETGDAAFEFGAFDGSRRPTHPTVPFPRPRPVPRTATLPNPSNETPDIGGRASWHGTTTRTLRFVFSGPDHRPQWVAALLVCAAAALVIFAVGRSPVAGTAGIGQTTGSLSAGPSAKADSPDPEPAAEASRDELAKASGSDSNTDVGALGKHDAANESERSRDSSPVDEDELAPGLVVPRAEGPTRPAAEVSSPVGAVPGAAKSRPAPVSQPAAKPIVKKTQPPPAPPPPSSLPTPARKNSTELDFGI